MKALSVGVLGAGGITDQHVPYWQALGAEVGVFSLRGADALAARFGLRRFDSLDALLGVVDVVDVCTSTVAHASLAIAALRAGLPVVCEKPLGLSFDEGIALATAASETHGAVLPAHVVRFFPQYERLHAAVTAGVIGRPAVLRFVRGGSGPTSDWFFDERQSGGIILDLMIHDLDQARWLAGEVTTVHAVQNPPSVDSAVPRSVVAHVTMTHVGGAVSHSQGFWGPSGMGFGPSFDVAGDEGRLVSSAEAMTSMVEDVPGTGVVPNYLPPDTAEESPYFTQLREFHRVLTESGNARVTLRDGVAAVAMAEAARRSVAMGAPVPFQPYNDRMKEAGL